MGWLGIVHEGNIWISSNYGWIFMLAALHSRWICHSYNVSSWVLREISTKGRSACIRYQMWCADKVVSFFKSYRSRWNYLKYKDHILQLHELKYNGVQKWESDFWTPLYVQFLLFLTEYNWLSNTSLISLQEQNKIYLNEKRIKDGIIKTKGEENSFLTPGQMKR